MTTPFESQAARARLASQRLALLTGDQKNTALIAMASALMRAQSAILEANSQDVATCQVSQIIDRLALDHGRLQSMADGLKDLAGFTDPIGQVVRGWTLAGGVRVRQVRVPFGVIGIIYEARPNVTADAAGICLKSGNAVLLRGSSSAAASNSAIVDALRQGLADAGVPVDAIQLVTGGHEATDEMMAARGLIDLLIPRGGASLIEAVVAGAKVPVIETGTGNCHLFVDASADVTMALGIIANAKMQRPSVCNALETVVVHKDIAASFVPMLADALPGVVLHGDAAACGLDANLIPATDWDHEFLSLDLRVAIADSLDDAIGFIRDHSSGHSETIVTNDMAGAQRFTDTIDAACVLVNASSRFVDGGQFGFGAEIGISTQKLHARGPMGLGEMTTTKYVINGEGQVRA